MKMIVHELGETAVALDTDRFTEASQALERCCELAILCEQQLRLFETMQPAAYLEIRAGLGKGSGLDSPGFKRINEVAPQLGPRLRAALDRTGVDLLEIYRKPELNPALLKLSETMLSFDAQ